MGKRDVTGQSGERSPDTDRAAEERRAAMTEPQHDQDYRTVKGALERKPALLHGILGATLHRAEHDLAALKNPEAPLKPDESTRLANAEKQYRKQLEKNAEAVFEAFQRLPISQKIDLLILSETIADHNDRLREHTRKQLDAAHAEAIARSAADTRHEMARQSSQVENTARHESSSPPAASAPESAAPHQATASITNMPLAGKPSAPAAPATPPHKSLLEHVGISNPAAVTVNLPFTAIPGLPALNSVLQNIDRVAHLDLGFTIKGVADRHPNPEGGHDVLYRMTYLGGGIMSSKFNIQAAPFNLTLEDRAEAEGWGGSSSVFTKHRSDLIGEKVSINFGHDDIGVSFAAEANYQKPSNRVISNFTVGRYFGEHGPAVHIPAKYVGSINALVDALPTSEDLEHIMERVGRVIPTETAYQLGAQAVEQAVTNTGMVQPALSAAGYLLEQAVKSSGLTADQQRAVMSLIRENLDRNPELPAVQMRERATHGNDPGTEP